MKKMKVLYYIHSLQTGGAEKIVTEYLIKLKERDISVALVVNKMIDSTLEKKILNNDIKVYSLSLNVNNSFIKKINVKYMNLFARKRWKKIIKDFNPQIIHIHTMSNCIDKIKFPADKIVFTFHTDIKRCIDIDNHEVIEKIKKLAYLGMHFFAINSIIENDIKDFFNTNNVCIIPNGLDLRDIRKQTYDKKMFIKKLGITDDVFVVGHIGRLHPVKNHKKIINVFSEIKKKKKKSVLLLIGRGSLDEVSSVKSQINELGLQKDVYLLGDREDATKIMSIMDVLIFPSFIEGFPLTLIEAQAQNLRCIISSTISADVICNDDCIALDLNETDQVWAEYAISNRKNKANNDIENYDIDNVMKKMLCEYKKIINNDK